MEALILYHILLRFARYFVDVWLVEMRGLEPLTSTVRLSRSSSWATSPNERNDSTIPTICKGLWGRKVCDERNFFSGGHIEEITVRSQKEEECDMCPIYEIINAILPLSYIAKKIHWAANSRVQFRIVCINRVVMNGMALHPISFWHTLIGMVSGVIRWEVLLLWFIIELHFV